MAANHIKVDWANKAVSRQTVRAMQLLREGVELLEHQRATMIQMRDGDGSSAAHYDILATEGGYSAGDYADANTAAKASFDELDSLYATLNSGAVAAINQACAKHAV
jgi:phosphoribosylformylglycinamidine (FGAM) synthase-like amidotransferase family enzyme